MENIIKKAEEGEYIVDISSYDSIYQTFMTRQFWQALGKACGWEENHFSVIIFAERLEEYWIDETYQNNLPEWLKKSIEFHEINLTQGFDKAVKWLEELIK